MRGELHYFLVRATGGDTSKHDHEVSDAKWVRLRQALRLMTYPNEREMVRRAAEALGHPITTVTPTRIGLVPLTGLVHAPPTRRFVRIHIHEVVVRQREGELGAAPVARPQDDPSSRRRRSAARKPPATDVGEHEHECAVLRGTTARLS